LKLVLLALQSILLTHESQLFVQTKSKQNESNRIESIPINSIQNANAAGAYFGATIIDAKSIENVDFTDAQFPPKTLALMCEREDMKGTNPTTGADTRESAMCP